VIKIQISLSYVILALRERARTAGYRATVTVEGTTYRDVCVWQDGTVLIAAHPTELTLTLVRVRDSKRLLAVNDRGTVTHFNGALSEMAPALRALSSPLHTA
jgi:hypothetical protein